METINIDLSAISKNYNFINSVLSPGTECACVLKCDAYGVGLIQVFKELSKAGCRRFFVLNVEEAIKLREYSITDEIYVLHWFKGNEESELLANNLTPVISNSEQVERWQKFAKRKGIVLPAVININTGSNLLGIDKEYFINIVNNTDFTKVINIKYIYSKLACTNINNHKDDIFQLNIIKDFKQTFSDYKFSFACSCGIFLGPEYQCDMVRPGFLIYGVNSTKSYIQKLTPVISLYSKIVQLHQFNKSETISYTAFPTIKPNSKVAIVPMGYYNGLFSNISHGGNFYISGIKAPIIGRVSMNSMAIDVTNIPENEIYIGREVEIIGDSVTIEQLATDSGLIVEELFLSICRNSKKKYIS